VPDPHTWRMQAHRECVRYDIQTDEQIPRYVLALFSITSRLVGQAWVAGRGNNKISWSQYMVILNGLLVLDTLWI